jgi:hypothetical protein
MTLSIDGCVPVGVTGKYLPVDKHPKKLPVAASFGGGHRFIFWYNSCVKSVDILDNAIVAEPTVLPTL